MIELIRDYKSTSGTHGTFALDGQTWQSLEPPDMGNRPYESCIPLGDYDLVPFKSSKYGDCFIMVNPDLMVFETEFDENRPPEGRFKCLFVHRGNEIENFVGCVGASHKYDEKRDRLESSTRKACETVNAAVAREGSLKLRISHEFE
jgi:hypothetical protein